MLLCLTATLSGAEVDAGAAAIEGGKREFGSGNYQQALLTFRDIVLNPAWDEVHGEAYYWIGRSYMALDRAGKALENLDYFLRNYQRHPLRAEGLYHKARLLIHRGEHQEAIKLLYTFTDTYPEHPYRANAFFWIGEALYSMGHFDEARRFLSRVVEDYPRSYKREAARYRLSLIDLKKRERELLKLLRISHEEYLKALEQFRRKEKEYEHAISSYQRKLAAAVDDDDNRLISELNREIEAQREELRQLRRENETLRRQMEELRLAVNGERSAEPAADEVSELPPVQAEDGGDQYLLRELLELKSEALSLKEALLKELKSEGGDS
jgi:TolA-binding protein